MIAMNLIIGDPDARQQVPFNEQVRPILSISLYSKIKTTK